MSASGLVLLYDRDPDFREALKNVLLAAGCAEVEGVGRLRDLFAELRNGTFTCVVVTLSRPFTLARRLALLTGKRQPLASLLFLVNAADAALILDKQHAYAIRERAFAVLPDLVSELLQLGWRN